MIQVTMPQAGQSMEEGTILGWRKREGEAVRKGEILLEIETDKANIEIEAGDDGILRKIIIPQGITVPVHTPIAIIAHADEDISQVLTETAGGAMGPLHEKTPDDASQIAAMVPTTERAGSHSLSEPLHSLSPVNKGRLKISPVARRIAQELGLDPSVLHSGSGPGGRILKADVLRAASAPRAPAPVPTRQALSGMRRAIARSLLFSKQNIPHFYMRLSVQADVMVRFQKEEKAKYPCTLSDVLVMACSRVIREFPAFRSRMEGDEMIESPQASIGLAVGMEDGLRVPVIVGAERLTLRQIASESRRIVEAAQKGKVEAMGQGVFTISNLGMFGIEEFSAIINPPEAAILAVGAVRETVLVRDGAMRAGRVMTMTLSADHRIIDGLLAARFMCRLREVLESAETLLREAASPGKPPS